MGVKKLIIAVLFLSGANLIALGYLAYLKNDKKLPFCEVREETKYIRGVSMEPIFEPEQEITALYGYYDCHKVERDDIVLLDYSGNDDPLIKIVKIIPGDSFHVEKNGEPWNILVNGEILKNSEGEIYQLDEKRAPLLESYEKQYGGVMPEEYYYILGNMPGGSTDSTRFGLVNRHQILAKVEVKP